MKLPKGAGVRDFQTVVLIKLLQSNARTQCQQVVSASGGFIQPDTELGATAASGNRGNLVMYFFTAKGQNNFLSKKRETEDWKYLNCRTINNRPVILRNEYELYTHKVLHKMFWQSL